MSCTWDGSDAAGTWKKGLTGTIREMPEAECEWRWPLSLGGSVEFEEGSVSARPHLLEGEECI